VTVRSPGIRGDGGDSLLPTLGHRILCESVSRSSDEHGEAARLPGGFLDKVYRRNPNASFTRFGDEGLIVVPDRTPVQLVVNESGYRVFELLDGTTGVGELARRVGSEYEGASYEQVVADLVEILDDLEAKGAVEVVEAVG